MTSPGGIIDSMTTCIYGMGRFGQFWAHELSKVLPMVGGFNRTPRELPPTIIPMDRKELYQADVIIICTAISSIKDILNQIAPHLKKGALVMDCCSVKVWPVQKMREILPDHIEIMGTHPMFGPDSGKEGIKGLPIVVSPVRINEEREKKWTDLFEKMGLDVIKMTPDEHDLEAAYTQGITHFIGRTLSEMGLEKSRIGTSGYMSLQRIVEQTCNDPWQLFLDLQKYNPYTEEMRSKLNRVLLEMENYIKPS